MKHLNLVSIKPAAAHAAETSAQDAAIVVSLALQHGCSIDTIRRALTRSGGSSGPVVALLDKAGTGA